MPACTLNTEQSMPNNISSRQTAIFTINVYKQQVSQYARLYVKRCLTCTGISYSRFIVVVYGQLLEMSGVKLYAG
jgi:hypothetical protein